MYIAVHLVKRGAEEGINAFLHEHPAAFPWPANAADLADSNPGKVVDRRIDLQPGGNKVRAYLDILAPNGTSVADIRSALRELRRVLDRQRNPTTFAVGQITFRFGVELGLEKIRGEQLGSLADVGTDMLDRRSS
jgi:hypothetical protein